MSHFLAAVWKAIRLLTELTVFCQRLLEFVREVRYACQNRRDKEYAA